MIQGLYRDYALGTPRRPLLHPALPVSAISRRADQVLRAAEATISK